MTKQTLEELIAEDLSIREIASRLDRGYSTIRYWLRRHDLRTTDRARGRAGEQLVGQCARHGTTRFVATAQGTVCAVCRASAVSEWRRRAKRKLVAEAGGRCVVCGYDRHVGALHFHHVDPSTKRFGLGSRGLARSIDRLREEVAKCVLLCANCHAEVEAGVATLPASASAEPHGRG